jgi:uncharacterized protein YggL (DUF469 family)
MAAERERVSQLRATLSLGLDAKQSEKILHALQEELLIPYGLYLDGGLSHFGDDSGLSPEIAGLVTRADGRDLSERDKKRVEAWLASTPQVREFSISPPKPADSPEFLPGGSKEGQ